MIGRLYQIPETRTIRGAYILKKGGITVDDEKKRAESKEEFEEAAVLRDRIKALEEDEKHE